MFPKPLAYGLWNRLNTIMSGRSPMSHPHQFFFYCCQISHQVASSAMNTHHQKSSLTTSAYQQYAAAYSTSESNGRLCICLNSLGRASEVYGPMNPSSEFWRSWADCINFFHSSYNCKAYYTQRRSQLIKISRYALGWVTCPERLSLNNHGNTQSQAKGTTMPG